MSIYRWLLLLYPASFRYEYGEEMRAVFARRRRDADGVFAIAALWLRTLGEVVSNAWLIHVDLLKQDLGYTIRMLRRAPGFASKKREPGWASDSACGAHAGTPKPNGTWQRRSTS